jgi:hypothetical protein
MTTSFFNTIDWRFTLKKYIAIITLFTITATFIFSPTRSSAGIPDGAIRIVAGSQVERAMFGIAEKAGVKYATETARHKSMKRWNWDWKDLDKKYEAEMKEQYEREMALLKELEEQKPIPIPEKPGFSKMTISAVAFLTGADLIFEGYNTFKSAAEKQEFIDAMSQNVEQGNFYRNAYDLDFRGSAASSTWQKVSLYSNQSKKFVLYGDGSFARNKPYNAYFSVDSINPSTVDITMHIGGYASDTSDKYHYYEKTGTISKNDLAENPFFTETFVPKIEEVPDISSVPDILKMTNVPSPGFVPSITPESLPEGFPQEVEIIIPNDAPAPVDQPANDPIAPKNPGTNPNPGSNPVTPESIDPGKNPRDELQGEPNPPSKPEDMPKPEAKLDFSPFVVALDGITHKFPFSIPWDLARQIAVFDVQPKAPEIDLDFSSFPGVKDELTYTLSLKIFDPVAAAARWFLTIAIDIGFILMLRRLMPE